VTVAAVAAVVAAVAAAALAGSARSAPHSVVHGNGNAATQVRPLPAFTGVELRGTIVVSVTQGSPQKVVVHADSNLVSHVTTAVSAGTLVVDTTGSFATRASMHVDVTVPQLTALTLSGHGVLSATGVSGSSLSATLSGSGVLRVSGSVGSLTVALRGTGDADLSGLSAGAVDATLQGTGRIAVQALDTLHATLAGTGAIFYTGTPSHVATSVTGTGTVLHD
jgi:type VI protein secretion system component VasA